MKTVLFVCTANIARSPMAEVLFNNMLKEDGLDSQYQARSAGTWAIERYPAPDDGQRVMMDRGLDTSSHLSQVVTKEIVDGADLVLTMEAGHKEALQIEFPSSSIKIFMLSEMVGSTADIDDPYKRGYDEYKRAAQEIEDILENGLYRILQLADAGE